MTSAQSLIGLVSQLQTMESSFTSILMEAALKLASLTDASIFMLVETPEGRRYAGRHHLCSAYQRGQLLPLANDKEMEADANTIGLKEKQGHATSNLYSEQFSEPIFCAGANMGGGGGRKRSRGSGNNEQSVSPAKHSKLNKARTAGADIMPSVPVKEEFDDYEVVHEGDDPGNSREGDESDIEEVYANDTHDFHDGSFNGSFNMINQSTNLSSALVPSSQQLDQLDHTEIEQALRLLPSHSTSDASAIHSVHHTSQQHQQHHHRGNSYLSTGSDPPTQSSDKWSFESFVANNKKYEALRLVDDALAFSNKDSPSWKIFSSVLYDLAKSVASHCQSLDRAMVSFYLNECFVEWWGRTPNLQRLHDQGLTVPHGTAHLKLKTYARNRTRSLMSIILKGWASRREGHVAIE